MEAENGSFVPRAARNRERTSPAHAAQAALQLSANDLLKHCRSSERSATISFGFQFSSLTASDAAYSGKMAEFPWEIT
jgi:hypothetical protein